MTYKEWADRVLATANDANDTWRAVATQQKPSGEAFQQWTTARDALLTIATERPQADKEDK